MNLGPMTTASLIGLCCVLLVAVLLLAYLLILSAASGAGEASEEIEIEQPQPEPECAEAICAWCHPGVDHAGGHGICPAHRAEMLKDLEDGK